MREHVVETHRGEVVAHGLQGQRVVAARQPQLVDADALAGLRDAPRAADLFE